MYFILALVHVKQQHNSKIQILSAYFNHIKTKGKSPTIVYFWLAEKGALLMLAAQLLER